jgi:hypothetical protein
LLTARLLRHTQILSGQLSPHLSDLHGPLVFTRLSGSDHGRRISKSLSEGSSLGRGKHPLSDGQENWIEELVLPSLEGVFQGRSACYQLLKSGLLFRGVGDC